MRTWVNSVKYNFQKTIQPTAPGRPGSAQAAAEAKKKYEREIDALARSVNQFRVEVQRFFAGDLKLPPDDLRERILLELRRLQNSKIASSADSFRLSSLEAQFNSHSELFGRRLREREQGAARRAAQRPELDHDAEKGIAFGAKPADGAVEALYKGLYLRGGQRTSSMDLERFRTHISKQAEALRTKTGADAIQFRVAEEGGKMKIKAKPIRSKA